MLALGELTFMLLSIVGDLVADQGEVFTKLQDLTLDRHLMRFKDL